MTLCGLTFSNSRLDYFICSYVPTRLWGFSGHVQTVIHSIVGRVKCPWPLGERVYLTLQDDSTLTYDLYQPLSEHEGGSIYSIIVYLFMPFSLSILNYLTFITNTFF